MVGLLACRSYVNLCVLLRPLVQLLVDAIKLEAVIVDILAHCSWRLSRLGLDVFPALIELFDDVGNRRALAWQVDFPPRTLIFEVCVGSLFHQVI